jgi:hypothetical protein
MQRLYDEAPEIYRPVKLALESTAGFLGSQSTEVDID